MRLGAARGATDFGAYFSYFSFFLVVSALLLVTLFFRLGIEQRMREIGLYRSLGYPHADDPLDLSPRGAAPGATRQPAWDRRRDRLWLR
jgi:hypothetical protein